MRPRLVATLVSVAAVGGLVEGPEELGRLLPYFPVTGTTWEDDALVWNGERYVDGDPISLGGGEIGPGGLTDAVAPDSCDDSPAWLVAP